MTQLHRLEPFADGTVVTLSGELDAHDAPQLRRLFQSIENPVVVLDLSRLAFLDSAVLGALVGLLRRQREAGGELRVVLPETPARRIFEVTGLESALDVRPSREHATQG
jgi:anti-sigma B factor antagonist